MTIDLAPHSRAAEWSVVGQLLLDSKKTGEVVGTLLEAGHFFLPDTRTLYECIVESFFAGDPIDTVTIGEARRSPLAKIWGVAPEDVPGHLYRKVTSLAFESSILDHAKLIREFAMRRELLALIASAQAEVNSGDSTPEQVADLLADKATKIATGGMLMPDLISYGDLGRQHINHMKVLARASAQGIELGAYFGWEFLDRSFGGLLPTELAICAGVPASGKSALWWEAGRGFSRRQMKKPPERQVGCLILSLEMGAVPSGNRISQGYTGVPSQMIREGNLQPHEIQVIASRWAQEKDLPLWFNFSSTLKASQLRAIVVEAVRRHNVGLVIIDHWRYFEMDKKPRDPLVHDEEKARFLKQDLAKELNIAVVCLAHTVKLKDEREGRPTMNDLRGSGQINAEADFLCFVYRPWHYASIDAINSGDVSKTDAELLFEKSRHNEPGAVPYYFDPTRMRIDDPLTY